MSSVIKAGQLLVVKSVDYEVDHCNYLIVIKDFDLDEHKHHAVRNDGSDSYLSMSTYLIDEGFAVPAVGKSFIDVEYDSEDIDIRIEDLEVTLS